MIKTICGFLSCGADTLIQDGIAVTDEENTIKYTRPRLIRAEAF